MLEFCRFHALLEITRFSSNSTQLLSDTSPLFRESPSSPINNVSSSLPSRRPANRTGGQGDEVNSNPVHRRGGNIRRLRITVDGQVQMSDDDSSGEPASNVRVVDAQESNRSSGTSRLSGSRPRPRFSLLSSPSTSHTSRTSTSDNTRYNGKHQTMIQSFPLCHKDFSYLYCYVLQLFEDYLLWIAQQLILAHLLVEAHLLLQQMVLVR